MDLNRIANLDFHYNIMFFLSVQNGPCTFQLRGSVLIVGAATTKKQEAVLF